MVSCGRRYLSKASLVGNVAVDTVVSHARGHGNGIGDGKEDNVSASEVTVSERMEYHAGLQGKRFKKIRENLYAKSFG